MPNSNNDAFFEELRERNRFKNDTYSNEDLQKLIDGMYERYASLGANQDKHALFRKILELIDVQIARAKSAT
jgi:anti-sigma-K factor RskA